MADDKVALEIFIEADKAEMTLGDLEAGFDSMKERLKNVGRGSEEFKTLSTAMAQTSAEIKNIELAFEGLDREQVASELGSVAGGIGDITASLVLLGGENETIEQIGASIEKAMAISMGFKGAIEGLSSANKLYNNLLKQGKVALIAKTAVEKTAAAGTWLMTAAQTAFNVVMSMNPIALVVIAITALVAGFILLGKNIKKVIDFALLPMTLVIDGVKAALRALGLMEESTAEQTKKAEEEKAKAALESAEKRTEATEKLIEAHKKLTDSIVADMDFEIRKRKANGEQTTELELEKLRVLIEAAKKERKLQAQRREDLRQEMMLRLQQGKIFNEGKFAASEYLKNLQESLKREKELQAEQLQAEQDLEISLIEIKKAGREQRAKDAEEADKKAFEERKARRDIELVETKEFNEEMYIEEEQKTSNTLSFLQLIIDKEAEAHQKELDRIEAERQARLAATQERLESASQVIGAIGSLNSAALATDLKNAGNNEKKKEQLRKASFEREKKLNIAMALVNGAQAQMSILAQTPKADFGIATAIAMAAAAVTTIAQIAAIKATSYQGGGSPVASESASVPSAGGAGAAGGGAAISPVTNTSTILGNQQVFVTETDITETQNNVSVIEESATF